MARRGSNSNSNYLSQTSGLSAGDRQAFSFCAWFYGVTVPTSSASYDTVIEFGASSGACAQIYTAGDPPSSFRFSLYDGTNFDESSDSLRVNSTWYHLCLVRTGNVLSLYVNNVLSHSLPSNAITPGTAWRMFNDAGNGTACDCRIAAWKYFPGVALTASQRDAEMRKYLPSLGNCIFYPFLSDTANYGAGNGSTWTQTGTTTVVEGPPLVWNSSRPRWMPYVVAAAPGGSGVVAAKLAGAPARLAGNGGLAA